jgi:hypothetical protein
MKFNWGTGILLVLVLFLAASAAFIIFAINQDVNLVHKDYYEKGVDYSEQMKVISRSEPLAGKIETRIAETGLQIRLDSLLTTEIDSGKIVLFRPSGKDFDLEFPLEKNKTDFQFAAENLINGRYILKVSWFSRGLKYEVDKQVVVKK